MKYYKLLDGSVRAIGELGDIDGNQSFLVQPDWVLMTAEEYEAFINPPKTPEQIQAEKFNEFNLIWGNLKICYDPVSKMAYRVKLGSELGETFNQNAFYKVSDSSLASGNVYSCNEQRMTDLANQINVLTVLETDTWIEPWASFETNVVEIRAVMLEAGVAKKEVYNQIFGV